MGYIKQNSIVVSGMKQDISKAHKKAVNLFDHLVSEIINCKRNGRYSFFIAPDASKGGWDISNEGNDSRNKFIDWIEMRSAKEGKGNFVDYAEIYFGEDNGNAGMLRHN